MKAEMSNTGGAIWPISMERQSRCPVEDRGKTPRDNNENHISYRCHTFSCSNRHAVGDALGGRRSLKRHRAASKR